MFQYLSTFSILFVDVEIKFNSFFQNNKNRTERERDYPGPLPSTVDACWSSFQRNQFQRHQAYLKKFNDV